MNKRRFLYAMPVLMLITFGLGLGAGGFPQGASVGEASAGILHGSMVCQKVTRADGTVEDLGCSHNTFMNQGAAFIANQINSSDANYIDRLILGNSTTPAVANTALAGEIFDCGLGAVALTLVPDSVNGLYNLSDSNEFTSTCSGIVVNTTALNSSGMDTGSHYFAANTFTATTLQSGDKLNVTWHVWAVPA